MTPHKTWEGADGVRKLWRVTLHQVFYVEALAPGEAMEAARKTLKVRWGEGHVDATRVESLGRVNPDHRELTVEDGSNDFGPTVREWLEVRAALKAGKPGKVP